MPYANFGDNYATKEVYDQQQQNDPDLSMGEFIFEKLLSVGRIFDSDDDNDTAPQAIPLKNQQPMQIQAGFIDCTKLVIKVQELPVTVAKPTCVFRESKFSFDFHASVFRPPSITA